MRISSALLGVAVLAGLLTACGGGGGGTGTTPPANTGGGSGSGGGPSTTPQSQEQNAVAGTDAAGAPVSDVTSFESTINNPALPQSSLRRVAVFGRMDATPSPGASPTASPAPTPPPMGSCIANFLGNGSFQGFEYWKPDRAGDANSTEYEFFYDGSCAQPAVDRVRVYTINGSTETQKSIVTKYQQGNSTPVSVSTETNTIAGSFDHDGWPVIANGFTRSSTFTLQEGGTTVASRGSEFIAMPSSSTSMNFCGDSAAFNAEQLESISQAAGWQELLANGSRTVNSNGTVTWSTTNASGSTYSGTPSQFAIQEGALNSNCPIATPAFTLTGGTLVSGFSVPSMTATFNDGMLVSLTITNATLRNGYTLNVTTNTSVSSTSPNFINGTLTSGGSTVATFSVNGLGDGTLTVTATGATYEMDDWHVVKDKHSSPQPSASPSTLPSASPSASPSPAHS